MVKIAKQHRHEVIPAEQTLKYIDRGLRRMLLTRGQDARTGQSFVGGFDRHTPFRPTQKEAAQALVDRISDPKIPLNDRRIGFYDHATGLGKTAEFAAVLQSAYSEAEKDGKAEELVSFIVVPTTNLLHQTKAEVEDYAPILKRPGMIGVYGDGKKELGKPVTIITYNSWIDLVESGQINPAKINIHIADEAHKNTSDRREEVTRALHTGNGNGLDHPDADSPQAFCLAVTATSRYDDEKTVERTYKHKLHEKSMMAGVESGELCEYIRPQEYLIRVDSGTKEDGWKKFVIDHFATGKDLESGQPLHKMVAAFYVNGTAFADDVAKDLNAHPDLAKLAKERGMLGVAVSIHSNMSPKEQERRLRDYMGYIDEKTGQKVPPKYMAVVGDEKFKAGWNHPPLKCIFDYTRGSLVDKSQIAGRGGRRYLDPKTGEPTGLVLIDTILYFGAPSEDKFNEGNRDRALANAVTFIQLLEGRSAVYRAGRKPREEEIELDDDIERAPRSGGRHIPGIGKVESFVSLSQVRNFNRQTAAAIAASQRDVVSDEEHRQLLELMAQKDMGAKALFELIPSERAKTADLTVNKIAICKRGTKLERPAWEVVVDILRQQPNAITDKEHQQLLELAEKKGLRAYLIFKLLPPKEAEALNIKQSKINACIHRGIRLKRSAWELVMQLLQQQPDQPKKE
ncbi:MAG: DEAD/DEAH box helicase, partial [Dongiaceae bacterium]